MKKKIMHSCKNGLIIVRKANRASYVGHDRTRVAFQHSNVINKNNNSMEFLIHGRFSNNQRGPNQRGVVRSPFANPLYISLKHVQIYLLLTGTSISRHFSGVTPLQSCLVTAINSSGFYPQVSRAFFPHWLMRHCLLE